MLNWAPHVSLPIRNAEWCKLRLLTVSIAELVIYQRYRDWIAVVNIIVMKAMCVAWSIAARRAAGKGAGGPRQRGPPATPSVERNGQESQPRLTGLKVNAEETSGDRKLKQLTDNERIIGVWFRGFGPASDLWSAIRANIEISL